MKKFIHRRVWELAEFTQSKAKSILTLRQLRQLRSSAVNEFNTGLLGTIATQSKR